MSSAQCERAFHKRSGDHWAGDRFSKCREQFISTAKDFDIPFASVLEGAIKQYSQISIDPEILGGTPRISGTRIPVYMVLDAVQYYGTLDGALKSYPQLSIEQVKEAISFAGDVLENPVDYESETAF